MAEALKISPMYGFGWFQGKNAIDVPGAFWISVSQPVEPHTVVGTCSEDSHEWFDWTVILTLRSKGEDGETWNVRLYRPAPADCSVPAVTGFAQIAASLAYGAQAEV